MQPGIASIDAMPRLRLVLRAGEEILVGGSPSKPTGRSDGKPFMGRANAWIAATARSQRLMEANGSADLFPEWHPLTVELLGARRGGALADAAESGLYRASEALSRGFAALARRISPVDEAGPRAEAASFFARTSLAAARALPWSRAEPHATALVTSTHSAGPEGETRTLSASSTVNLPARSDALSPDGKLARAAPFWSEEERATYVALHEFGHSAHHLKGLDPELHFGAELLSAPELDLFGAVGVLPAAQGVLPDYFFAQFGEGYADCFAALGMGGGSLEATLLACDQVRAFRGALAPAREEDYSGSDPVHDTRETVGALREALAQAGRVPSTAEEVDRLCLRAAQIGAARWVANLASRPAGVLSDCVWSRGRDALAGLDPAILSAYSASYETERDKALATPWLRPVAESLPEPADARKGQDPRAAARCASLSILNAIESSCGGPRLRSLAGGPPAAPSLEALAARLIKKRSAVHEAGELSWGEPRRRRG